MLDLFRSRLKPVDGRAYRIEDCSAARIRRRKAEKRCVLQYTLRVAEPRTGRRWDQWVTGLIYAKPGKAEAKWKELQAADPRRDIPGPWQTFEPVDFFPDLGMLVQVFPFDRRLRNLSRVMGDPLALEPQLLDRLGPGEWTVEERTVLPIRYRAELGATLQYTIRAREARSGRRETYRCYVKVYRRERGDEAWRLLQSIHERSRAGRVSYSVIHPIAYLSEVRTLVLAEASGRSLAQSILQEPDPMEALRRVARAVAAFNQDDLPIGRREARMDHLEIVKTEARLLEWACPNRRAEVHHIVDAMAHGLDDVPLAPIHGDLKPDHVFLSNERVIFIDLDCAAFGDPVRDPAHLAAYLLGRVGLDSLPPERARALSAAFVEEYFRHVPKTWRRRFVLHRAGALLEVASGICRQQGAGWRARIGEVLDIAEEAISMQGESRHGT